MATHSSILAWRIPGTEEPSGLPSMALFLFSQAQTLLLIFSWDIFPANFRPQCLHHSAPMMTVRISMKTLMKRKRLERKNLKDSEWMWSQQKAALHNTGIIV